MSDIWEEKELPSDDRLLTHRLLERPLLLRSDEKLNDGTGVMAANREQSYSNSRGSVEVKLVMLSESLAGGGGIMPLDPMESLLMWKSKSNELFILNCSEELTAEVAWSVVRLRR